MSYLLSETTSRNLSNFPTWRTPVKTSFHAYYRYSFLDLITRSVNQLRFPTKQLKTVLQACAFHTNQTLILRTGKSSTTTTTTTTRSKRNWKPTENIPQHWNQGTRKITSYFIAVITYPMERSLRRTRLVCLFVFESWTYNKSENALFLKHFLMLPLQWKYAFFCNCRRAQKKSVM